MIMTSIRLSVEVHFVNINMPKMPRNLCMLLKLFTIARSLSNMEFLAFILLLQGHTKQFGYITAYKVAIL